MVLSMFGGALPLVCDNTLKVLEHRNIETKLAKLSKEGMGIAILPDFLAFHPGFGDGLVRVLNDWEAVPAHIFAVTPSAMQSARIRKLVSFLKEHFEAMLNELSSRRKS